MTPSHDRVCPKCRQLTSDTVCEADGYKTVPVAAYADETDPLIGTVFDDRYRLIKRLGEGGMGAVYLARQLTVGRDVAVKMLHTQHSRDLREVVRFQQEAKAIAALNHPNTIQLVDFGQRADGTLYLVTEYLEGTDLRQVLQEHGPMEPNEVHRFAVQILGALQHAHEKGIVHRDLKPANLFLTDVIGAGKSIKILDFGIAKLLDSGDETGLTRTGYTLGSPPYMAPEQIRGETISPQCDLYALGCVLFELMTGDRVFGKLDAAGYRKAHREQSPPEPRLFGRTLSGPLVDLMLQCLNKSPEHRPASAKAALELIETKPPLAHRQDDFSKDHDRSVDPEASTAPAHTAEHATDNDESLSLDKKPYPRVTRPLSTETVGTEFVALSDRRPSSYKWALGATIVGLGVAAICFLAIQDRASTRPSATLVSTNSAGEVGPRDSSPSETVPSRTTSVVSAPPSGPGATPTLIQTRIRADIDSIPSGATVMRGEKELGLTPLTLTLKQHSERLHLKLKLEGYEPANVSFIPDADTGVTIPFMTSAPRSESTIHSRGP